jgi:serine/threonine-protein kinase
MDINPPDIRVRDFGSRNGTFLNDKKIGQRKKGQTPEEGAKLVFREHDLRDGDLVRLEKTTFQVCIAVPAVCGRCQAEVPEPERESARVNEKDYLCANCRKSNERLPTEPKRQQCAKCGRDVSAEKGANRQGTYICQQCKRDPWLLLKKMLGLASQGRRELFAIRGYSIVKELGRGGMGAVYLARHEDTNEQVAIKIMLPQVAVSERAQESFLREARNTQALVHRNIVSVRDSGCSDGTFFLTIEFCERGSVDKLMMSREGVLPIDEALSITMHVLDGLEYAHQAEIPEVKLRDGRIVKGRGIVHRDLKPGNIFQTNADGQVVAKIGDYGLSKAFDMAGLSGHTCTGEVAGTPCFMPRQQILNYRDSKPEVDVWAAAASLYSMLTGYPPSADCDFTSTLCRAPHCRHRVA